MNARVTTQPTGASSVLQSDSDQKQYLVETKSIESIAMQTLEWYEGASINQKVPNKRDQTDEEGSVTIGKPLSAKKDSRVNQFENKLAMIEDRVQRRNVAILGAILALSLIVAVVSLTAAYVLVEMSALFVAGLAFMSAAIAVYKVRTMFEKYDLEQTE